MFLAAALAALVGCGPSRIVPGHYRSNDLMLAPSYRAKEVCSCLFVLGQTEDFCTAWTVASPNVAHFTVDYAKKTVEAEAFLEWGGKAVYVDDLHGCTDE